MRTEIIQEPPEEGLSVIEGEFFTENYVIQGTVTSPEFRLSEHLNSGTTTFELKPSRVQRSLSGLRVNVAGSHTYVSKAHLLFVLPIDEPVTPLPTDNTYWSRTITQTCWAGLGRYSLVGKIHMDAGRNPRLFLRSLEQRQFLPLTDVRLTFPDGATREYPTVIVNRFQLELLAIEGET